MVSSKAVLPIVFVSLMLVGCATIGIGEVDEDNMQEADPAHNHDEDGLTSYLTEIDDLAHVEVAESEKLKVIATTTVVGDVVSNVGGEAIDLNVLLPSGTDPHGYTATPRDLTRIADADLIFVSGFGLEQGLAEDLAEVASEVQIVSISEGVETLAFESGIAIGSEAEGDGHEGEEHEHEGEDHEHEHEHGSVDPHIWFDPVRVMMWVENAAHALSSLDPDNQDLIEANANSYLSELEELDEWIHDQVARIPLDRRLLVTDHESFTYFAERYDFTIIGAVIPAYSTTASPSAREIAELNDLINEHKVSALFVGTTANPRLAESIAEDTGIEVVPLFTGSLGPEGGSADSYIGMMKTNVSAIVEALAQ